MGTPLMGKGGNVTINGGNYILHVRNWNITINAATHPITTFDQANLDGWERVGIGILSADGSFECMVDSDDPLVLPGDDDAAVELLLSASRKITGTVAIHSLGAGARYADLEVVTYNFKNNGPMDIV